MQNPKTVIVGVGDYGSSLIAKYKNDIESDLIETILISDELKPLDASEVLSFKYFKIPKSIDNTPFKNIFSDLYLSESLIDADLIILVSSLETREVRYISSDLMGFSKDNGKSSLAIISSSNQFHHKEKLLHLSGQTVLTFYDEDYDLTSHRGVSKGQAIIESIKSLTDLFYKEGMINVDYGDVQLCLSQFNPRGFFVQSEAFGVGGEGRAIEASERVIDKLGKENFSSATALLINITAGLDMTIGEFEDVANALKYAMSENALIVVGSVIDPSIESGLRVSAFLTGVSETRATRRKGMPVNIDNLNILASEKVSSHEIADFINTLSSLYALDTGDELIIAHGGDGPELSKLKKLTPNDISTSRVSRYG
jgi:hypothetical protein